MTAYAVGLWLYWLRFQKVGSEKMNEIAALWIAASAILGAAIGSKVVFWLEHPEIAFADFPSLRQLMIGKTIVGGLAGGWIGVEIAKWFHGVRESTGDRFVVPLVVGISIGRLGCYFAGIADGTFGVETRLPWGVDFGDGLSRHPTALYEIAVIWIVYLGTYIVRNKCNQGDQFKFFMYGYFLFRFGVEYLKPREYLYADLFSGIQVVALFGALFCFPSIVKVLRR
jgi:prolipoprotein diacylglyceryltransferase